MSTVGLVVPEDIWSARSEHFLNLVLAGIEDVVVAAGHAVLTQATSSPEQEIAVHRRWAADGAVGAVVLRDLREDDPRPAVLAELGMPYVLIGDVVQEHEQEHPVSTVTVDNAGMMRDLLGELLARGHRSIGHVGGPQELLHSGLRRSAYREVMAGRGLPVLTADGDYTAAGGARALEELLPRLDPGGVLVLDNDAMALGALDRARELQLPVPDRVSLVSWEDSMGCQLSDPPLTALGHALRSTGALVGASLIGLVQERPHVTRHRQSTPVLLPRASLGMPG
ncbi:LacI family DNA-binding transcriptional regulator [Brachybacterium hainanense]|uniref:LacI family DNA-binding transcriptional regulator n=1 Tax=Brachybacterium hainanense TaxID=1541174 RepID=A0ABV6R6K4_9MICO